MDFCALARIDLPLNGLFRDTYRVSNKVKLMLRTRGATRVLAVALMAASLTGCLSIKRIWRHGGEVQLAPAVPTAASGPHVIIFALDGAGHDQFLEAVRSGKAPNIQALLGKEGADGLFAHAYSARMLTMLPSSTIADWSAIFTGDPPAYNGVTGDEWFERETRKFYAPVPVSVTDTADAERMITGGLIGQHLHSPTMFELIGLRSNVSLLPVHRAATFYTTVSPSAFTNMVGELIKGALKGQSPEQSVAAAVDLDSVRRAVEALREHGAPNLQVIYLPGIDIYTHASKNPLRSQVEYIEKITNKAVGEVLNYYREEHLLGGTYVLFIADHGHTPTMNDDRHAIGAMGDDTPRGVLEHAGFRVRRAILGDADKDYQAVLAYQGFMAYIYLADRSTCPHDDQQCAWRKPPRFDRDVMPALRALDHSNRFGRPVPRLRGTIDLIFARRPVPAGQDANPFEVYYRGRLVPIRDYLHAHPRPDLIDLSERMKWLGKGPYGNHAGDIVLLARTGARVPINSRYYFAGESHYSWHGSADASDSYVPLVLAQEGDSGKRLRDIVLSAAGDSPTELDITPLVRALFGGIKPRVQASAAVAPDEGL
jgi:hypothetical protein